MGIQLETITNFLEVRKWTYKIWESSYGNKLISVPVSLTRWGEEESVDLYIFLAELGGDGFGAIQFRINLVGELGLSSCWNWAKLSEYLLWLNHKNYMLGKWAYERIPQRLNLDHVIVLEDGTLTDGQLMRITDELLQHAMSVREDIYKDVKNKVLSDDLMGCIDKIFSSHREWGGTHRVIEDEAGNKKIYVPFAFRDELGECSLALAVQAKKWDFSHSSSSSVWLQVKNILESQDLARSRHWPKLSKYLLACNAKNNAGRWRWDPHDLELSIEHKFILGEGSDLSKVPFFEIIEELVGHAKKARRDILFGMDSGVWEAADIKGKSRFWRWLGQELVWPWQRTE